MTWPKADGAGRHGARLPRPLTGPPRGHAYVESAIGMICTFYRCASVTRTVLQSAGSNVGRRHPCVKMMIDVPELAFDLDGALEEEADRQFVGHAHATVKLDRLLAAHAS